MYFIDDDHKKAYQALAQKHSKEGDYLAAYYILSSGESLRNITFLHIDKCGDFSWSKIKRNYKNLGSTHRRMAMLAFHLYGGNGTVDLSLTLNMCDESNAQVIQQAIGVKCFRTRE